MPGATGGGGGGDGAMSMGMTVEIPTTVSVSMPTLERDGDENGNLSISSSPKKGKDGKQGSPGNGHLSQKKVNGDVIVEERAATEVSSGGADVSNEAPSERTDQNDDDEMTD